MVYIKLEKTDIELLSHMAKDVNTKYSITELSEQLKKPYVKVHSSVKRLSHKNIINISILGKSHYCSFDYKNNFDIACFIEAQRTRQFSSKNRKIKIFLDNIKEKLIYVDYSLVIFGSFAKGSHTKNSDLDLAIISSKQYLETAERTTNSLARISPIKLHLVSFSYKDFVQMLWSNNMNVAKEIIKNHIIFHGCEKFYECLGLSK